MVLLHLMVGSFGDILLDEAEVVRLSTSVVSVQLSCAADLPVLRSTQPRDVCTLRLSVSLPYNVDCGLIVSYLAWRPDRKRHCETLRVPSGPF